MTLIDGTNYSGMGYSAKKTGESVGISDVIHPPALEDGKVVYLDLPSDHIYLDRKGAKELIDVLQALLNVAGPEPVVVPEGTDYLVDSHEQHWVYGGGKWWFGHNYKNAAHNAETEPAHATRRSLDDINERYGPLKFYKIEEKHTQL